MPPEELATLRLGKGLKYLRNKHLSARVQAGKHAGCWGGLPSGQQVNAALR